MPFDLHSINPHMLFGMGKHFVFTLTLQKISFLAVAFMTFASAVAVVTMKNIFHSLLFLVLTFLGIAGIYLLLSADFLAAVQVLVYVGAITVLIMFALMLTSKLMSKRISQTMEQWIVALPVTLGILVVLIRLVVFNPWGMKAAPAGPTTGIIGTSLMTKYLLPFELASIVLLVAMVGAILLAKEDKPDDPS